MTFQLENAYIVLGTVIDAKPILSVIISDNIVKERSLNAGQIVREAGKEILGGGGGQPFYATAGGKNPDGIAKAVAKAIEII